MDYNYSPSPSLKQKLRSFLCLSCCFRATPDGDHGSPSDTASLLRSSSAWVRSTEPEIDDRFRSFASRIRRQRRRSVDFTYDPLDYALNFDDGLDSTSDGGVSGHAFQYRSFSSRLPASPPVTIAVKQF